MFEQNNLKIWIDIFSACLTPAIGILGAYIAYQQWLTSEKSENKIYMTKGITKFISQ